MIKLTFCLLSLRFIRTFFVFVVFQFAFLWFISLRFCGFQHFLLCGSRFLFLIIDTCNSSGIFFFCVPGPFPAACGKILCFLLLITISVFHPYIFHTTSTLHPYNDHLQLFCLPKRTAFPQADTSPFGQRMPQLDTAPIRTGHPPSGQTPSWTTYLPHSDRPNKILFITLLTYVHWYAILQVYIVTEGEKHD